MAEAVVDQSQESSPDAIKEAADVAKKLAYQSAKKWVMGVEGGLIAGFYTIPVALLMANLEWVFHSRQKEWPMPYWEKAAIIVADIFTVISLTLLVGLIVGVLGGGASQAVNVTK